VKTSVTGVNFLTMKQATSTTMNTTARPLLDPTEVATRLHISRPTLYRLLAVDMLPGAVRVGGQWRINSDEFEAWLAGEHGDT
jgi:excisionase family DNA binding protein